MAALRVEGWETIEVPPALACPDSVFVEDTVVVYGDLAVISRPGADERKPETARTEETLRGLGYRIVRIEALGTLGGGDVLKRGGTVWAGLGGRTNQDGVSRAGTPLLHPGSQYARKSSNGGRRSAAFARGLRWLLLPGDPKPPPHRSEAPAVSYWPTGPTALHLPGPSASDASR
ncbi:hypothetical protein [Nocardioides sp. SYSU DS0663]|uniref:hypothetical protein n=1 Tax=Nocardioides sp. SYSU DS0663 TaxID=3416445 RepID=UPI003F4CA0A2